MFLGGTGNIGETCFLVLLTFIETDRPEFSPKQQGPVLKCQPDFLAQNNFLIKRDSSWRKIYEVLAARMRKLITARARKNKGTARMLANARKDH